MPLPQAKQRQREHAAKQAGWVGQPKASGGGASHTLLPSGASRSKLSARSSGTSAAEADVGAGVNQLCLVESKLSWSKLPREQHIRRGRVRYTAAGSPEAPWAWA